jgi:signal transduction histidine kinase
MTEFPQRADHRDDRRHARTAHTPGGMQAPYLLLAVVPAAVVALLAAGTVAFVRAGGHSAGATRGVLIATAVAMAVVLLAAAGGASAVARRLHQQSVRDLQRERHAAAQPTVPAATPAAAPVSAAPPDQRVEVFVNLARRMQSLVHREIQLLDDLEGQVEDPVLLKGLFTVDHLATRMRRQSESLAVLGGAVSRRQWTRPVSMHEVLRAAVAEVEQYSRVKVVPPVEGVLQGTAVADVIHLIAELIENATKFSPPQTQALLRAQFVTAGLAIEVDDRGLGMLPNDRQRMNELLTDPGRVNLGELMQDGRIGLFVVSALARRHGVRVHLQGNIYGGTQAVIVLPKPLIDAGPEHPAQQTAPQQAVPSQAVPSQAVPPQAAPSPAVSPQAVPPQSLPPQAVPPASGPQHAAPRAPVGVRERPPVIVPPVPSAPAPSAPMPSARPASPIPPLPPVGPAGRPPLPRREDRSHLAPQLRDAPATRRDEQPADQIPGLMAAFQQGISRASEQDSPAAPDNRR